MKDEKLQNYRIDKPMDYLHRRLFVNNGPLMHDFFDLPGEYEGRCPNKFSNSDGSIAEIDVGYLVKLNNKKKLIINVEDETSHVNEKTLLKLNKYRINFQYAYGLPVFSIITTSIPSQKCLKELEISPSDIFRPKIISYPDFDGEKILNTLRSKILNNKIITKKEFLKLILVIRTFYKNHSKILEEICNLINKVKTDDIKFKMEMVYCSRYIIHKYAKSIENILQLEEVVGLKQAVTCGSIIDDIKEEGKKEGILEGKKEGILEGKLDILKKLVNDSDCPYTIEELSEKFGFTVEQIKNGK